MQHIQDEWESLRRAIDEYTTYEKKLPKYSAPRYNEYTDYNQDHDDWYPENDGHVIVKE